MPLVFENEEDYSFIGQGSNLVLENIFEGMDKGKITLKDKSTKKTYTLKCFYTDRQKAILKAGGLLQFTKGE